MEADIIPVYYGIVAEKFLRYIRLVALRRYLL